MTHQMKPAAHVNHLHLSVAGLSLAPCLLWLSLSLFAATRSTSSLSVVIQISGILLFWSQKHCESDEYLWRKVNQESSPTAESSEGLVLRMSLVPALLQSIGLRPEICCVVSTLLLTEFGNLSLLLLTACASFILLRETEWSGISETAMLLVGCYYVGWRILLGTPSLHLVFTQAEWSAVTSLVSAALTLWWHAPHPSHHLYQSVAMTGFSGCCLACLSHQRLARLHCLKFLKYLVLPLLPLVLVELLLWSIPGLQLAGTDSSLPSPRSLFWLAQFLIDTETVAETCFPKWPRFVWLIYWAVVLVISLSLAPTITPTTSITMARKWFHLVALVLFVPVTVASPQLQSFGYAVALALLMILECVRTNVVWLNAFYERYVDHRKDLANNNHPSGAPGETVIVSHMTLILGCAAPLWMVEYMDLSDHDPIRGLLSLWGVLCLGVGDAMGAVVGTYFGRYRWGAGNRTLEGSLAMFLSMAVPGWFLVSDAYLWLPAVVFTTILEAYTLQIDNLVLPLAGSAVILLCHRQ